MMHERKDSTGQRVSISGLSVVLMLAGFYTALLVSYFNKFQ